MPRLDDYLYQALTSPTLWASPHPLIPVKRLQETLHLHDGGAVADWLYAQDTVLACTRVAQWLSALEETLRHGHDAARAPLVRAFWQRAFIHLWDFLEREFANHVFPLLCTAPADASVALVPATAAVLHLLDTVSFPRLAASSTWWAWLQDVVPCQPDPESAPLAVDPTLFLAHLSHGLTQLSPTLSPETQWQVAQQARELTALLATLCEAGWERVKVRGLFAGQGRGAVRDVWVYARAGGRGAVTHSIRLARDPSGAFTAAALAFDHSLTQAVHAANQYVYRERHGASQLDVHLFLEEGSQSETYAGPSLGLAVALALIAHVTQRQVPRSVAVTGEVHADGALAAVAGLPEKLSGVADYNACLQTGLRLDEPITTVVLPAESVGAVDRQTWQARGLAISGAATLREAVDAAGLLDPWAGVVQACAGPLPPLAPALEAALTQLDALHRTVLVIPYTASADEVLRYVARTGAAQRQQDSGTSVPVLLKLLPFAQHESLAQQVLQQLQAALPSQPAVALDLAHILRQIQRGGCLWLFSGLDDLMHSDAPSALLQRLLAQLSNPPFSRNAAVFACRQSTWERARPMFAQAVPPFRLVPLYEGRSTCLDWHQQTLVHEAAGRLAACRVGGRQGREIGQLPRIPNPEEFFYGGTPDFPAPLYLDIHVRETFLDGTVSAPLSLTHLIASSENGQRVILQGSAGAGKSTELLKLFFDCGSARSPALLRGVYAPLLLEARGLCDRWGRETYADFLHRMRDALRLPEAIAVEHFEQELRFTPRLLVLLDGLDEVKPEGLQGREQVAETLWRFIHALHPSSAVVLASRTQERGRAHESLLSALEVQRGVWRTCVIDDLALDTGSLRRYLQRIMPGENLVEALMTTLQGRTSVLKNPLLVHLFGSVAPQKLVGRALNPGTIYRAALETWLDEEINVQGKPKLAGLQSPPGTSLAQVAIRLLGVVAHGMVEQGTQVLATPEARDVLAQFVATCLARDGMLPGWWPLASTGQRPLGVVGDQVRSDELDIIVRALAELCVMQ